MRVIFRLDQRDFRRAIARRIATGRKAATEVVTQAAKGVLKTSISITPPASQGKTGRDAKKQGEEAIRRDILGVFELVDLKKKRPELHPDVEALYLRLRKSRGNRFRVRRDQASAYYVSRAKALRLLRKLAANIGILASAWFPAATKLKVALPAWIKRHGRGRGAIDMRLTNTAKPTIIVTARMPNPKMAADLQRRVDWAVRTETRKMERQWRDYLRKQQEHVRRTAA